MYVKNEMTKDVITVLPESSISAAFQIMHESKIKNIPVVKDNKLVGIITDKLLSEFSPSKATTLSIYEINYILSKTQVAKIMKTEVLTCTSDMLIEEVATQMLEYDVHMIPVVDADNNLEAVITRSDILRAFISMIGVNEVGTRYTFSIPDKKGVLAEITSITKEMDKNITHLNVSDEKVDNLKEVVLKVDSTDTKELDAKFAMKGYNITRVDIVE